MRIEVVCMETSIFCKPLVNVSTHCSRYSNQISQFLPRVTNTSETKITNCFIHRIQLKTVKSQKVIWCLGCLSPLSAQVITLASEFQEIMAKRGMRNSFSWKAYWGKAYSDQIKSGSCNSMFGWSHSSWINFAAVMQRNPVPWALGKRIKELWEKLVWFYFELRLQERHWSLSVGWSAKSLSITDPSYTH